MKVLLDTSLVLVILTTLITLGSSRLVLCIRLVAVQGSALCLLPLATWDGISLHALLLVIGTFFVKGGLLPWLLLRARREADVPGEVEPYIGFGASILAGVLMLAASFLLGSHLPLQHSPLTSLLIPTSFFGLFAGLFLIVSRRLALTQVLGYLIMENGIFVLGIALLGGIPVLVELGVLLDVFVAVFVMGIAIYHISREFEHIDVDRLKILKG